MSLLRMDRPSDGVRFLDDLDLTLSMDKGRWTAQQVSSIEITLQPVVFRVSYRDINLITAIVNKAIELSTKSQSGALRGAEEPSSTLPSRSDWTNPYASSRISSGVAPSGKDSLEMPRVISTKEQVRIPSKVRCCANSDI